MNSNENAGLISDISLLKVQQAILSAIDEINDDLPEVDKVPRSIDTVLFGIGGNLDSLGLVRLLVATENNIEEQFQTKIIIADEHMMAQEKNPFDTVSTLAEYVSSLLDEGAHG